MKISISLSSASIDKAIKQLNEYKKWVSEKTDELLFKLAMVGFTRASVRFKSAYYTGENDAVIDVESTPNGYAITASGESVCFIEFGAGVYYNGSEPYPIPRPDGVEKIGEYGKGKGKQNAWGYYDDSGNLVITHGTPAAMPMYYTAKEMKEEVKRIAMEVFANG